VNSGTSYSGNLTINKCEFSNCKGYDGAGIWVNHVPMEISNSIFINCRASNIGGVIYVPDGDNSTLRIFNCKFEKIPFFFHFYINLIDNIKKTFILFVFTLIYLFIYFF
jgi:hypothetical protein